MFQVYFQENLLQYFTPAIPSIQKDMCTGVCLVLNFFHSQFHQNSTVHHHFSEFHNSVDYRLSAEIFSFLVILPKTLEIVQNFY